MHRISHDLIQMMDYRYSSEKNLHTCGEDVFRSVNPKRQKTETRESQVFVMPTDFNRRRVYPVCSGFCPQKT